MSGGIILSVLLLLSLLTFSCSYRRNDHDTGPVVFRPPPLTSDYISPACWNFTYGNRNLMEFYSPNYPNNYTKNSDCIQYLEAPEGYTIDLDIRDFVMEQSSNCQYDYLEIRNGPFGYSPFLARLCGKILPPIYNSATPYLWLRFKTDGMLQKEGFSAVYSYVKDEGSKFSRDPFKTVCRIFIDVKEHDGIISGEDVPYYVINAIKRAGGVAPLDCTWEIRVPPGSQINLRPLSVDIYKPEECDSNLIEVYDGRTVEESLIASYCDTKNVRTVSTTSNRIYVRVVSKTISLMPKIRFLYTAYRSGDCNSEEFSCNNLCLHSSLKCNKNPNCYDKSDEGSCNSSGGLDIPYHAIILGSIGCVLILIALISVCFTLRHKRAEQKKHDEFLRHQKKQLEAVAAAAAQIPSTPTTGGALHSPGLRQNGGMNSSYVSLPRRNDGSVPNRDPANRASLTSALKPFLENENPTPEQLMDTSYFKKYFPAENNFDEEITPCPPMPPGNTTTVMVERHMPPAPILSRDGSAYWKPQPTTKLEQPVSPFFSSLNRTTPYKGSVSPNTYLKGPLSSKPLPVFNSSDLELDKSMAQLN